MDLIPTSPKDWVQGITILILGAFSLLSVFGKGVLGAREQNDKADDRLISLLKSTVEELERKVKALEEGGAMMKTEITKLRTENDVMTKVLQGRDNSSSEYQKQMLQAAQDASAVLKVVTQNSTDIKALYGLIERHLQALEA